MHLAVKKELAAEVSKNLLALRGRTIDVGETGSGTRSLALAIMDFVGLKSRDQDPKNGYIPLDMDRQQLFAEKDTSRMPDAVFLVSTLPSFTTRYLTTKHDYRLVPLPFAEALALGSLEELRDDVRKARGSEQIVLGRVQSTMIPAYTYSIEPPVPDKPLPTLGTRLILVAHKDVPARAAYRLVEEVYSSEFGQIVHPPLDARLMELPPEFPWHDGALLWQKRNAPVLSGAVMDSAQKGFAIFAAAASGLFVLWQWRKMQHGAKHAGGLKDYIAQVTRIEKRAIGTDGGSPPELGELIALKDRLHRLKTEALEALTEAEQLADKDLLFGFLLQANDVRDNLSRRILRHEETEPGTAAQHEDTVRQ
jgi:hypothetical protein